MYRQGDVLVIPCNQIPEGAEEIKAKNGRHVLAEGEVTGHFHGVPASSTAMFAFDGKMYLRVQEDCKLSHQEHGSIELSAGDFQVTRQREYTPWGTRQVED